MPSPSAAEMEGIQCTRVISLRSLQPLKKDLYQENTYINLGKMEALCSTASKKRKQSEPQKRHSISIARWIELVEKYKRGTFKSRAQFLRSEMLDPIKYGNAFKLRVKYYDEGKLKHQGRSIKRLRNEKFPGIEEKLVHYIKNRVKLMQRDKVGLSFAILQAKARLFANQLAYDPTAFHASPGWVSNVLKRHEFVHVNL